MNTTLQELATLTGGTISQGSPDLRVTGFGTLQEAEPGDITFLGNSRYAVHLKKTRATVLLVDAAFQDIPGNMAVIRVDNPTLKFGLVVQQHGPQKRIFPPGIHPTAAVGANVVLDVTRVHVGAHAVIEDGAHIGNGSEIHAGAYIGHECRLGEDCIIHPHAVIKERCLLGDRVIIHSGSVIGTDGFGYEFAQGRHVKIDQVGIVQLDSDVEVGSCTTIDRSRFGRTWVGEGCKIDNLVQIGHNCILGRHCIVVSQVGISGSARLGSYVTLAGQVGVGGHLEIGDRTTFLAKSGLTKDYPEAGAYTGYPARPLHEGRRLMAYPGKVPDILERLKVMEKRIQELEAKLGEQS